MIAVVDWKVKKSVTLPKGLKKADELSILLGAVQIRKGKDTYVIPLDNFQYIKYKKVKE